jgi:hypothetical protein
MILNSESPNGDGVKIGVKIGWYTGHIFRPRGIVKMLVFLTRRGLNAMKIIKTIHYTKLDLNRAGALSRASKGILSLFFFCLLYYPKFWIEKKG